MMFTHKVCKLRNWSQVSSDQSSLSKTDCELSALPWSFQDQCDITAGAFAGINCRNNSVKIFAICVHQNHSTQEALLIPCSHCCGCLLQDILQCTPTLGKVVKKPFPALLQGPTARTECDQASRHWSRRKSKHGNPLHLITCVLKMKATEEIKVVQLGPCFVLSSHARYPQL